MEKQTLGNKTQQKRGLPAVLQPEHSLMMIHKTQKMKSLKLLVETMSHLKSIKNLNYKILKTENNPGEVLWEVI